jgi:hypothetical protein
MGWQVRPRLRRDGWEFTYQGRKIWRKLEADAWDELNRRQRLCREDHDEHGRRPPLTIASAVERWEEDHGNQHAAQRLDDLVAWKGSLPLSSLGDDFLVRYHTWLTSKRSNRKPGRKGEGLSRETVRKNVRYAGSVLILQRYEGSTKVAILVKIPVV